MSRLYDFYYRRRQSLPDNSLVPGRNSSDGTWDVYDEESGVVHRTFDSEEQARGFVDQVNEEMKRLTLDMEGEEKRVNARIREFLERALALQKERAISEEAISGADNEPEAKALPSVRHGLPWLD